MGEQGGGFVEAGSSVTSSTYGEAQVKAVQVWEDGTTFTGVTMPEVENAAYIEGTSFNRGEVIFGIFTAFTVSTGAVQTFLHKKSTV